MNVKDLTLAAIGESFQTGISAVYEKDSKSAYVQTATVRGAARWTSIVPSSDLQQIYGHHFQAARALLLIKEGELGLYDESTASGKLNRKHHDEKVQGFLKKKLEIFATTYLQNDSLRHQKINSFKIPEWPDLSKLNEGDSLVDEQTQSPTQGLVRTGGGASSRPTSIRVAGMGGYYKDDDLVRPNSMRGEIEI